MPLPESLFFFLTVAAFFAAAFMLHLYRLTGNVFAFAGVQGSWNRHPSAPWTPFVSFLRRANVIGEPWNLTALNLAAALLMLPAAVWFLVRREWSLGAYALLSLLLHSGSAEEQWRIYSSKARIRRR